MKKLLLMILGVLIALPVMARDFQYTYEGQTLNYNILSETDKTVAVSKNNVSGDVKIPAIVKDGETEYTVTSIGGSAFVCCSSLTSIELPNTLTSIGDLAFDDCSSLTSIELPNSLTSIGKYAFELCRSLKSIVIPSSVTAISNRPFGSCFDLRLLIILAEITINIDELGCSPSYIFAPEGFDCSALNNQITRFDPATTNFLDDYTIITDNGKTLLFAPIYEGNDYAIPEGVTKISAESFGSINSETPRIGTLTIPSTIEEIEANTFKNVKIEKVNFTDWTKWYPYVKLGNLYANPYRDSKPYVGGVQMVTPELPEGITEIPDYINYGLQFKNEIELPRLIKRIGAYAFYNNKELYSVILPPDLEEIGESAFEGCELLENPSFPAGLKKIENGVYKDCTSITEIVLPEGVTTLGSMDSETETIKGAFEGCTALEKAVIAVDVDYIVDNLFKNCTHLYKVYLPLQLKSIGKSAFERCAVEEITFPATLETIGEKAFYQCNNISKITIPDRVNNIGEWAFAEQSHLTTVTIGKGLEVIPSYAFSYDTQLKVINFSEGLKEIGKSAFANVGSLGSVVIPSTMTQIADGAFANSYISNLEIPDRVENLGSQSCGTPSVLTIGRGIKTIASDAFKFDKLYTFRLKAHMPPTLTAAFPLTSQQNDQLTLIVNSGRHDTYNTNARWKQIDRILEEGESEVEIYLDGTYSLAEEIRIQSGYMPSVVTKMMVDGPLSANDLRVIKENMVSLTSLDLSNVTNLTALPDNQFKGSLLTEIVLPSNLESIGNSAFNSCSLLQLTELPASVKNIGNNAFSSCPSVNLISLPASLETIGSYAFSSTGMTEFVANEKLSQLGGRAFENCKLLERIDLSATSLTQIGEGAFYGCHELDEVILPSTVEQINNYAFSGTAIRNIDFASEVTNIGDYAFSSNRRLVSATLPASLTSVGSGMFADCPRLISLSMPETTANVGAKIVQNDRKLASLSCAATESPDAATGAFDDVRFRYITLTIPTLSFRKYLNAAQWGKFESTKNTIKVKKPSRVTVTSTAESEYQDMLVEDAREAAQEAAAAQSGKISKARAMRRAAARAHTPRNFATVFDGAQLMSGKDGGANRIFITPDEDVIVTSILFNDEELISSFDGESVLLPQGKSGSLEIIAETRILGDVNNDGEFNTADLNTMINGVMYPETTPLSIKVADMNNDGVINTVDINIIINNLMNNN